MTQPGRELQQAVTVGMATLTGFLMASELRQGDIVAQRYRIEHLLGMGGMGLVYQAWDNELNVPIALKLLRPELASRPDAFERFRQELLLARQVSSPHVVRIHDLVRHEAAWMISMDFVDGESLERRLDREGALPADEALRIAREIALGLAAAHHRGVIHRDLKPANILLTHTGEARITDFGVARSAGSTGITGSGVVIGTPAYLSPEQARADPLDGRSDLYALGLILYEMLTGVLPFRNGTAAEMLAQRLFRSPDAPDTLKPGLPTIAVQLCSALLEIRPAHRLQSADEVATAIASGRLAKRSSGQRRRFRRLGVALAFALSILAVGSVLVLRPPMLDRIIDSLQVTQAPFDLAMLPWRVDPDLLAAPENAGYAWHAAAEAAYVLLQAQGQSIEPIALMPRQLTERSLQALGFDSETAMRHRAQLMQTLNVERVLTVDLRKKGDGAILRVSLSHADAPDEPLQAEAPITSLTALGDDVSRLSTALLSQEGVQWQPAVQLASLQAILRDELPVQGIVDPAFWRARLESDLSNPPSESALQTAEQALSALPENKDLAAQRVRSLALSLLGDEQAEATLREALTSGPDPVLQYQLGLRLLDQGKDVEAREVWLQAAEIDHNNPEIWFQLGRLAIMTGDASTAVEDYLLRGLMLSNRVKDRRAQARITNAIGMGYRSLGQPDQAIDNFERSAKLWQQESQPDGEATALLNLGSELSLQGRFGEASAALGRAETLASELGDRSLLADVENDLGVLYEEQGHFDEALRSYRSALAHRQETGDASQIISSLLNVGFAYYQLGEFDNAQVYWQQAETQASQSRDVARIVQANHAKALALMARGEFPETARLIDEQIQQAESLQLGEDIPTAYALRAQWSLLTGDLNAALDASRKALALFEQRNDARGASEMRLLQMEIALDSLDPRAWSEAATRLEQLPPDSAEQQAKWHLLLGRAAQQEAPEHLTELLEKARVDAAAAHSLPLQAETLLALAMQHDALGDSTAAVGLLQQARELVDSYPSVDLRLQLILASVRIRSPNAPSDYREARSLLQRIGPWRHAFQLHLAAQHLSAPLNAEALTSAVEARQTLLQRMPASMSTHFAEVSQRMLDQPKASP